MINKTTRIPEWELRLRRKLGDQRWLGKMLAKTKEIGLLQDDPKIAEAIARFKRCDAAPTTLYIRSQNYE